MPNALTNSIMNLLKTGCWSELSAPDAFSLACEPTEAIIEIRLRRDLNPGTCYVHVIASEAKGAVDAERE